MAIPGLSSGDSDALVAAAKTVRGESDTLMSAVNKLQQAANGNLHAAVAGNAYAASMGVHQTLYDNVVRNKGMLDQTADHTVLSANQTADHDQQAQQAIYKAPNALSGTINRV